MSEIKTCTQCNKTKSLTQFSKTKVKGKEYPRSQCKTCTAKVNNKRNKSQRSKPNPIEAQLMKYAQQRHEQRSRPCGDTD